MKRFRKPLVFALCILPAAALGGYFSMEMNLAAVGAEQLEEAVRQAGSLTAVKLISAAQIAILYGALCGFFGYVLSGKIGLMRPFRLERTPVMLALCAGVAGGAVLALDAWTFARWIPELGATYGPAKAFDAPAWIASVLYGGVVEEVMMRLFLMSLFAFLGWKLFRRGEAAPPRAVLIAANVLAAVLFAAGHLPATALLFGRLTPLLVVRCFLLNGGFGLVFGRLYRRRGIQYAMIAHAMAHVVSRTVWLLFLP